MSGFSSLPNEILYKILSYLTEEDKISFTLTSERFFYLFSDPHLWSRSWINLFRRSLQVRRRVFLFMRERGRETFELGRLSSPFPLYFFSSQVKNVWKDERELYLLRKILSKGLIDKEKYKELNLPGRYTAKIKISRNKIKVGGEKIKVNKEELKRFLRYFYWNLDSAI